MPRPTPPRPALADEPHPGLDGRPDRPGRLRLGGHDRAGRGALRRSRRADRPVRPQHRPGAARDRPDGSRRRAVRGGLSEYPPSDYRRLVAAAAARYGVPTDELLVGAGADEILDIVAKAFLPAGAAAVIPTPTYAMYRVLTEQRARAVVAVPRLGPDRRLRDRRAGGARGRRGGGGRLAVQPEQPDRRGRARRDDRGAAGRPCRRCRRGGTRGTDRRPRRGVRRVRRGEPRRAARAAIRT